MLRCLWTYFSASSNVSKTCCSNEYYYLRLIEQWLKSILTKCLKQICMETHLAVLTKLLRNLQMEIRLILFIFRPENQMNLISVDTVIDRFSETQFVNEFGRNHNDFSTVNQICSYHYCRHDDLYFKLNISDCIEYLMDK